MKNKQKQLKIKGKKHDNALKSLESLKPKELNQEAKAIEYSNYGDYVLKGLAEIRKNNQPIDFLDLTYNSKGSNIAPICFVKFKGPNHIFKSIYNGDIALEDEGKEQIKLLNQN